MSKCKQCFVMSDGTIKLCYECLEKRIKELEESIANIKKYYVNNNPQKMCEEWEKSPKGK